ncbi:hypothetical protein NPIL_546171 [Nephila pilipes]|uniref:Uncharacterized protein n=1 Tax=Nephila pilipes TaxID=299642 RepID=A0A8X6N7E7_NEPPI|nr:hypothetical protein NPIL_546171 [Nephila pilipes]
MTGTDEGSGVFGLYFPSLIKIKSFDDDVLAEECSLEWENPTACALIFPPSIHFLCLVDCEVDRTQGVALPNLLSMTEFSVDIWHFMADFFRLFSLICYLGRRL